MVFHGKARVQLIVLRVFRRRGPSVELSSFLGTHGILSVKPLGL